MRTKTSLAAKKKKPKLPHHMNDKIILAQNIKGTGKATFEGLYDIDDDPVTVVVDKNDDGVYIVIYNDISTASCLYLLQTEMRYRNSKQPPSDKNSTFSLCLCLTE